MAWQPDPEHGAGSEPGPGLPGGHQASGDPAGSPGPERDPGLAGFAPGGEWDTCPPSAALATALEAASGPGWRCPGASRDELFGLLGRWAALESWAAAGKLGLLRELIREDDLPFLGGSRHGDLPDSWSRSLTHEVALALALAGLPGPRAPAAWQLTRGDSPGPPGGHGTWTLTLPDGRNLTVRLEPVPAFDCDHRHESHAYQPNGTLRHLVQVRDHECTFPACSRHARESDFEHALPYHKGGRTCACNAGARSRRCHQIKQSPGWNLTQLRPGWHQWKTPSGRVYTQGPKRYPA